VQKLQGPGLSKGAKIGITAAVVIGVLVVAVVIIIAKTNKALNNARF
jgi:tetrahydromethanopterin S-methyltransferase subunit G